MSNKTPQISLLFYYYFLMAIPVAYENSQARDGMGAAIITYAPALVTRNPLSHCVGLGIEPVPPQ